MDLRVEMHTTRAVLPGNVHLAEGPRVGTGLAGGGEDMCNPRLRHHFLHLDKCREMDGWTLSGRCAMISLEIFATVRGSRRQHVTESLSVNEEEQDV